MYKIRLQKTKIKEISKQYSLINVKKVAYLKRKDSMIKFFTAQQFSLLNNSNNFNKFKALFRKNRP